MDRLSKLGITLDELHGYLKDADYDEYCRTRDGAYKKLARLTYISKPTFAVFWHGLMCKLEKHYGFTKPHSTNSNAVYHRTYRDNEKKKDALRMRKIRANEAHIAKLRSIRIENAPMQKENLEALEEIEDRLGYLALSDDLKT